MRRRALGWVLLVGVGLGCGEPARPAAKSAALASDDAAARLSARLAPRLAQTSEDVTIVTRPDGRRSVRLNGSFSRAQMARLRADGTVETECVDTLPAAERVLRAAADGAAP